VSPLTVASMLPAALQEETRKANRENEVLDVMGVMIELQRMGGKYLRDIATKGLERRVAQVILIALDEGKTLDQATADVIGVIYGGN